MLQTFFYFCQFHNILAIHAKETATKIVLDESLKLFSVNEENDANRSKEENEIFAQIRCLTFHIQRRKLTKRSYFREDKLTIAAGFTGLRRIIKANDYLARILIEPRKRGARRSRVVGPFRDLKGHLIGYVGKGIERGKGYYAVDRLSRFIGMAYFRLSLTRYHRTEVQSASVISVMPTVRDMVTRGICAHHGLCIPCFMAPMHRIPGS